MKKENTQKSLQDILKDSHFNTSYVNLYFDMKMLNLKSAEEIECIRESALIVSKTLGMLAAEVKPGISTLKLDQLAESFIRDHGAIPGFLGLYDFPNTLCVSPNTQVVHGIPKQDILKVTERFYRSKNAAQFKKSSSGLGLSIVKHIVNRHAGRLVIESEENTGSIFKVFLPVYIEK